MKLGQYIKQLQEVIETNSAYEDLDVIYAKDDEGNGYQHINYSPTLGHNSEEGEYYAEFESGEECDEDDINCICVN